MTDPTQQGFVSPPSSGMIALSKGEAVSLAEKAAKGVGYSWGEAEDIGAIIRRAGGNHQLLLTYLATYLSSVEFVPPQPVSVSGGWRSIDNAHCPLRLGVALLDSTWPDPSMTLSLGNIRYPVLFFEFLPPLLAQTKQIAKFHCRSYTVAFSEDGTASYRSAGEWKDVAEDTRLTFETRDDAYKFRPLDTSQFERVAVQREIVEALQALAHRTYAPETEASRARGAGSGQPDTD